MESSSSQTRKNRPRKNVDANEIITFDQFYEIAEENVITDLLDGEIFCGRRQRPGMP